tara:strand:+ start:390 stop:1340 length:951 start_codon:yes stop_codon:yes gene_type:complete
MIKKVLFLLIVISSIYLINNENRKIKKEAEKKFSIENINEIDKVFLSDRKGNNIVLKKDEDSWFINERFKVRKDAINTLLTTINEVEVQRPVSNTAYNNVIKQLATTGVKVEIYYKNNIKTYTVGGSTSDHLGTYMLMEDGENPYVVHIPGFNGFLSPRYGIQGYELDINNWRDNTVFEIDSENIKEISLKNYDNQNKSFRITNKPLKLLNIDSIATNYNIDKIIEYFNLFSKIECERYKGFDVDLSTERLLYKLNIKYKNNDDILDVYSFSKRNNNKNQSEPNVERFYARLNNGEIMLIQKYVFNKVFISINDLK